MGSMPEQVRRLLRVAVLALGAAGVVTLLRKFAWLVRYHRMTCKLPAMPPGSREDEGILGYTSGRYVLGSQPANMDNIRSSAAGGIKRLLRDNDELRRAGVLNYWFYDTRLARLVPNSAHLVVVHGIEGVRKMLAAKHQPSFEKGNGYKVSESLIGRSVLATRGEEWREQRFVLDHGFKDDVMRLAISGVTDTVQRIVDKLCSVAARDGEVDMLEESLKLTVDVLGRFAFSYDFGSIDAPTSADAPLYAAFNTLLKTLNMRCLSDVANMARVLPLPVNRRYDAAMRKLDGLVTQLVSARKEAYKANGGKKKKKKEGEEDGDSEGPGDLLDIMLGTAVEGAKHSLTEAQMVDNIKTMLFAGHDTTAAALTWALYLLSAPVPGKTYEARREPERVRALVERIRREYEGVLGTDPSACPDFDDLQRLPFLDAVVTETLRLYPSAGFSRNMLEDLEIGGHVIPEGTEVLLLPYLTHRDPDNFDEPDEFIPERWEDRLMAGKGESASLRSKMSRVGHSLPYLPFSLGQRNCVGRNLALNEIKIALVKLLQRLDFQHVDHPQFKEHPAVFMTLNPNNVVLKPCLRTPATA